VCCFGGAGCAPGCLLLAQAAGLQTGGGRRAPRPQPHGLSARPAPPPIFLPSPQLFLEAPGDLASNITWQGLAPPAATVLEGTAKFSMQLIGRESKVGG
jgi:hypothetical protein